MNVENGDSSTELFYILGGMTEDRINSGLINSMVYFVLFSVLYSLKIRETIKLLHSCSLDFDLLNPDRSLNFTDPNIVKLMLFGKTAKPLSATLSKNGILSIYESIDGKIVLSSCHANVDDFTAISDRYYTLSGNTIRCYLLNKLKQFYYLAEISVDSKVRLSNDVTSVHQ